MSDTLRFSLSALQRLIHSTIALTPAYAFPGRVESTSSSDKACSRLSPLTLANASTFSTDLSPMQSVIYDYEDEAENPTIEEFMEKITLMAGWLLLQSAAHRKVSGFPLLHNRR